LTDADLARLNSELDGAVAREEFELAAMLRDTIRNRSAKQVPPV
jgi:protein-arginine kinase activator protein McsA